MPEHGYTDKQQRFLNSMKKLRATPLEEMSQVFICQDCRDVVHSSDVTPTIDQMVGDFLVICNPCALVMREKRQLKEEEEKRRKNRDRYLEMQQYLYKY